MQEITNKKFFTRYAFFVVLLLIVFGILSYSAVLSRKSWTVNLGKSVQKTLDEYETGTWHVESPVNIDKPVSINSAAYTVKNKNTGEEKVAVIIRITTFYGPLPAVYLYDEVNGAIFAGYSSLHGRIREQLLAPKSDKRREYWQRKIPEILNQAGGNK